MSAAPAPPGRRHAEFVSVFTAALGGDPCLVHGLHPTPRPLPVGSWDRPVDAGDRALLRHCRGPVLDVGCGPGRMAAWLTAHGVDALGIDLVPAAVERARARGARAEVADVFAAVPGRPRWGSVLLADGNIGIGGDPVALLLRVRGLLAPDGRVVVDLAPPGSGRQNRIVRLEGAGIVAFRWAVLGPECLPPVAADAGLDVLLVDERDGRWFAVLGRGSA